MQSRTILMLVAVVIMISAVFATSNFNASNNNNGVSNVSLNNGIQIIALEAKGGFSPANSTAKADLPSLLRVTTNGTFDCSSTISIPSLSYRKNLPASGTIDIDVPPQTAGTTLQGTCSMGMYHFSIAFE